MDARQRDVLIAVIREYVDSAEPVGSRVVAKRHLASLSPATIRNTMSDLEEKGYLKKALVERAHVYRPAKPRQQVIGRVPGHGIHLDLPIALDAGHARA